MILYVSTEHIILCQWMHKICVYVHTRVERILPLRDHPKFEISKKKVYAAVSGTKARDGLICTNLKFR